MTDERIDVEVVDKIDGKVASKILAIAAACREADTSLNELKRQISSLDTSAVDRLATAAAKVTTAQAKQTSATAALTNATTRQDTSSVKLALTQQRLATETQRTEVVTSQAAAASARAATAATQQEVATSRLAITKLKEAAATDVASAAQTVNNRVRTAGAVSTRQQLQQTQNLIFQLNDIVVGLASGQKPLTVLLQQGSQISTIYGPGKGVVGVFSEIIKVLGGFAVAAAPWVALLGVGALAVRALQNEINKTAKTQVSFGDTFKAIFQVIGHDIYELILPALKAIDKAITSIGDSVSHVLGIDFSKGFFGDVSKQAQKNALARLAEDAEDARKKVKTLQSELDDFQRKLLQEGFSSQMTEFEKATFEASVKVGELTRKYGQLNDEQKKQFESIKVQAEENVIAKELANITQGARDYREQLEAITALQGGPGGALANSGLQRITPEQARTALAKTQLRTDLSAVEGGLPGTENKAAIDAARVQADAQIAIVQDAMKEKVRTEKEGADLIASIHEDLDKKLRDIEAARNSVILTGASDTFAALADAAAGFAGKQSGVYQGLFVVSKAFAIADSIIKIQQGIANAFALPYPANIAAAASVAAATASIVSSIEAIQFSAQGKADGGYITGPGGPRDDKVPIWASNGEFVVNSEATRRNRPLLEAINDNRVPRYASGGMIGTPRQSQSLAIATVGGQQQTRQTRGPLTVQMNVYTADANSFNKSRTQVAAGLIRTVNSGYRNL